MDKKSARHFLALLRYARPYRSGVLTQFLLMGVSIGFGLLKPWPLKIIVDHIVETKPLVLLGVDVQPEWPMLLLAACVAYLLFHGGEALVQVFSGIVATLTSSRMVRDLRADLLARLQSLSLRFHDSQRVGDLVHRVTYNSSAVETAFQSGFMGTIRSSVTLAAMFVIMISMNISLAIVALAVVPLLLLCIRWYARKTHTVSLEHQNQEGKVSSRLHEVLSSIRLVKAYNRSLHEQERFNEVCEGSVQTRLRATRVEKNFGFYTAVILAAGTSLMFWVGVHQVKSNQLTIGEFLVFISYLAMLYAPLSVLSYTASSIQSALGGGTRLFEILESKDEITNSPTAVAVTSFTHAIRLQDVTFGYEDAREVLHGINLEIRRGEMLALAGETGCGKSTLLSLLLRFYDPWRGPILIDGVDVRHISVQSLRELIAFVPQDTILLSDSIRENIAYARPGASDAEIEKAAVMASAHEFIAECPRGYDTLVGERGIRLSAGQRQRLALARAFLKNAPILLLDEPTSALDGETELAIMQNLHNAHDKTIVVVAHRLSTVRYANRIIIMKNGHLIEEGRHEELLAREGAYHRLWHAQVDGAGSAIAGTEIK